MANKKLKSKLGEYVLLMASFTFLIAGVFLMTPVLTGFSVAGDISENVTNLFGVVSFMLAMTFLLVSLRKIKR